MVCHAQSVRTATPAAHLDITGPCAGLQQLSYMDGLSQAYSSLVRWQALFKFAAPDTKTLAGHLVVPEPTDATGQHALYCRL